MDETRDLIRAAGLSHISPFYFFPSKPATLPNYFLPDSIMLICEVTNVKGPKIMLPDIVYDRYFTWFANFGLPFTPKQQGDS